MKLAMSIDEWALREPFVIAGRTTTAIRTLTVTVADAAARGWGEALGVDYRGETPEGMRAALEGVRARIESGIEPEDLEALLPPGGARNALDCALWDLRLKRAGRTIWQWLGLEPRPVLTLYTLSLGEPAQMAAAARRAATCPILKLKLDAVDPEARIVAVRSARPDAELVIDANGSWDLRLLDALGPVLAIARIAMVEQPLPAAEDGGLCQGLCPAALCADESCQSSADLDGLAGHYRLVNIKLDKCGGLTEGLRMLQCCRRVGLEPMIGNMLGSSLAMAPALVIARSCRYVDLDGPLWQRLDREPAIRYDGALMHPPEPALWG